MKCCRASLLLSRIPRLTARKFLAAANFLELLSIFGEVASDARPTLSFLPSAPLPH